MNSSLQYSALTRLLTLNTRIHDLENQLRGVALPVQEPWLRGLFGTAASNQIAEIQEEIDRGVRASLTTCWLGLDGESDE